MSVETNKSTFHVRPRLQVLTPEHINQVHEYSVRILENTGIKIESESALEIFKKSGGVQINDDVVKIKKDLIEHAIKSAPSNIPVYNRSGELAFNLGASQGPHAHFGFGGTNTHFEDLTSGEILPFTREHMRTGSNLVNLLNNYDFISTIGVCSDVPAERADLFGTLDMAVNTKKPLVLLVLEDRNMLPVIDLLNHLFGDFGDKPSFIPYFNPVTPLVLNASTTDKMIDSIKAGLPVIYSNYAMTGATAPAGEGSALTLLNAELLAGLVFGQLIREGCGMILGSLPASFNMRTSGSAYTPVSYILNLANAEMMNFYGIPHCGASGSGNGWRADLSAAGDLWQNHLTSCFGKVGCAPFVGGNFDSLVFSPATVVLSDMVIEASKRFSRGFELNENIVNLSEIDSVGQGGNYLTSEQTLASLAEASVAAEPVWPALDLDAWQAAGKPKAEEYLVERTKNLLKQASENASQNIELLDKGEVFISQQS